MNNIFVQNSNEDSIKRVKIIFLSLLIPLSLFFTKVFAQSDTILDIYIVGGTYFLLTLLGLTWSFNFKVKLESFKYILLGSFFVFSEVIFVLFFFFKEFDRIYESLLLIIILILIWIFTYSCFLMVNVFNVSLFKPLPLLSVAQTALYILTLLMVYFFTFGILASGFPIYISLPLLFVAYLFLFFMEFKELGVTTSRLFRLVLIVSTINIFLLIPFLFVGSSHELISIVPTVGGFVGGGLLTLGSKKGNNWQIFGYNALLFFILLIITYLIWF